MQVTIARIQYRLDASSLDQEEASTLKTNDIARLKLKLAQPIFPDPYADNRATGAFILIDEASNNTVGAGMIQGDMVRGRSRYRIGWLLDR